MGIIKGNVPISRRENEKRAISMIATWKANTRYFLDNELVGDVNYNASIDSTDSRGNCVLWCDKGNKKRFSVWINPLRDEKRRAIENGVMVAIRFGHDLPLANELYESAMTVSGKRNEKESFNNKHEVRLCVSFNQLKSMLNALSEVMNANDSDDIKPTDAVESVTA